MSLRPAAIVVAALLVGIAARAALVTIAPRFAFFGDHVDYVCWSRQARDAGLLALYDRAPGTCPAILYEDGRPRELASGAGERLNYPPLAAVLFWLDGHILAAVDRARTANTITARAVLALSTSIAELVTAFGVAALVRRAARPTVAALAFAATWLAPPLLADGPFWGQTESWILAPVVWMVWAMGGERWVLAGGLWGIALALKPSGLLFAPLWIYALVFRAPRARVIVGGGAAVVTLNVIALPFWLWSGTAWLRSSYLANYVYELHWTTMMTFNVWYAELLINGHLDSRLPLLGVARDTWGSVLTIAGLVVAFAVTRRWERRAPEHRELAFVPLAALVTLVAVSLSTRVHSTYTAFTAPFLVATACLVPRSLPAAAVMIVAATLQILSWQWGNLLAVHLLPDEGVFPPVRQAERRALRAHDMPREWALTLASLAAAAGVCWSIAKDASASDAPGTTRPRGRAEDAGAAGGRVPSA